jgi:hypothetical protein
MVQITIAERRGEHSAGSPFIGGEGGYDIIGIYRVLILSQGTFMYTDISVSSSWHSCLMRFEETAITLPISAEKLEPIQQSQVTTPAL